MTKLALRAIRWYQLRLSSRTGVHCRYQPSCSAYTYMAIGRYGWLRGGIMGAWRIARCNPFSAGGFDPVKRPAQANNY